MSNSTYNGAAEVLVLGIDIGTTSSAVSISHLSPGATPSIRTVTSWPSHPLDSKLPSLVAFPRDGSPPLCGAEAKQTGLKKGQLGLCEYFKLHLHPQSLKWDVDATLSSKIGNLDLAPNSTSQPDFVPDFTVPPLPHGVSIERVYSTFIAYLVKHAQTWFGEHTLGGNGVWSRLCSSMEIVMGIPDGWDEHQCEVLKKAIVASGVIGTKEEADKRVEFLRESEASVHFALESDEVKEWMKAGVDFTVADLGGSTCDTCMYHVDSVAPKLVLREVKPSDSVQAGGIFVDRAARTLLENKLASSTFNSPAFLSRLVSLFELRTKRAYSGGGQASISKFGGMGDNDARVGIRAGRLTLSSSEVASAFTFCKNEILSSVKSQVKLGSRVSKAIVVTGGFGESPYLQQELRSFFSSHGIQVVTSSQPTKKAVAEGLAIWKTSKLVCARAVRFDYGLEASCLYDPSDSEHSLREQQGQTTIWADGKARLPGWWSTIVNRGEVVAVDEGWEEDYVRQYDSTASMLTSLKYSTELISEYTGNEVDPKWSRSQNGQLLPNFRPRCTIQADLSNVHFTGGQNAAGALYFQVSFKIVIFVAETTLKAKIAWYDGDGKRCEGPATIIFHGPIKPNGSSMNVGRRLPADNLVRFED